MAEVADDKTRVLLVDDHPLVRQGLRTLLGADPAIDVVGEATDGNEAIRLAADLAPHVVIMDLTLPDVQGSEATRRICHAAKDVKVIGLSAHSEQSYASQMLKAGATGYVVKDLAAEELITAIRTVMSGKIYLSSRVAGAMLDVLRDGGNRAQS